MPSSESAIDVMNRKRESGPQETRSKMAAQMT
jgi:hypothetical protein